MICLEEIEELEGKLRGGEFKGWYSVVCWGIGGPLPSTKELVGWRVVPPTVVVDRGASD